MNTDPARRTVDTDALDSRDSIAPVAVYAECAQAPAPVARPWELRLGLAASVVAVLAAVLLVPFTASSAAGAPAAPSSAAAMLVNGLTALVPDPVHMVHAPPPAPEAVLADAR